MPKNWYFWTVVLEKTLESPLVFKEIKPVNPKANQSWIFIGKTDAEAETSILWPLDAKNWLTGKDPVAGKDWRQEEKGMAEHEMVECINQLNGHEFEKAPGVGDGQGSLTFCSSWGCKLSDTTEWPNWTESKIKILAYITSLWILQRNSVFYHSSQVIASSLLFPVLQTLNFNLYLSCSTVFFLCLCLQMAFL